MFAPVFHILNIAATFTSYQSFLENGLTTFFLATFLPLFERHCFAPCHDALREPKGLFVYAFTNWENILFLVKLLIDFSKSVSLMKYHI